MRIGDSKAVVKSMSPARYFEAVAINPVISKYWIRIRISVPSRRVSIVIVEHSAEPLSPSDCSCFCVDPFDWSDRPISQALMISFSVIIRNEFSDPVRQRVFTEEDAVGAIVATPAEARLLDSLTIT